MLSRFRKTLFSFLLAGLCTPAADAQTVSWAQSRPFPFHYNNDYVRGDVAALPGGGAWWVAPKDFREMYNSALTSVELTKFDASGVATFQHTIEGNLTIQQITAAPDGGVVLTGFYKDSLVYDARHRLSNPHLNLGLAYFIGRIDAAGQVRWLRRVSDPANNQVSDVGAAVFDQQGQLWLGYESYDDSYITRYSVTGDSLQTIVQHHVRRISSLAVAPDGTFYVAGACADPLASFGGQPFPPSHFYNIYVACYEPTGQIRWVRYAEDITCPVPQVATADNNGVYLASHLHANPTFGNLQAGGPAWGGDFFLTRLDRATGTFQWLQEVPQIMTGYAYVSPVKPLAVDASGNAWLLAEQTGTIQWSPSLTTRVGAATNSRGVVLLSYDVQGTLRTAMATSGGHSEGLGLSIDPMTNKGVLTGLNIIGSPTLGSVTLPAPAQGAIEPFIVGFDASLTPLAAPSEAPELPALAFFPNPVASGEQLTVRGVPDEQPITVTLLDAVGRMVTVLEQVGNAFSGEASFLMPPSLPAGLYAAQCSTSRGVVIRRVSVKR